MPRDVSITFDDPQNDALTYRIGGRATGGHAASGDDPGSPAEVDITTVRVRAFGVWLTLDTGRFVQLVTDAGILPEIEEAMLEQAAMDDEAAAEDAAERAAEAKADRDED